MLLTREQVYILDLLNKLKYMKKSQLLWFLKKAYSLTDECFERELRQLRYLNRIWVEDEYVLLPERKRDNELMTAVDIMLCFCGECIPSFAVGTKPCKLVFFTQTNSEKVQIFKLFFVSPGTEQLVLPEVENQNRPPNYILLFFLQEREQMSLLSTSRDACFVLQNENGGFAFYR